MISKPVIIDCHISIIREFEKLYPGQLEFRQTSWNERKVRSIEINKKQQAIFYMPYYTEETGGSAHITDGNIIIDNIKRGSILIIFVGQCSKYHIENISGYNDIIQFCRETLQHQPSLINALDTPFKDLFSQFGVNISYCIGLTNTIPGSILPFNQHQTGKQIIATHRHKNIPVSFYIKEKDWKGFILLLPFFNNPPQVINYFIKDLLPSLAPYLYYDATSNWLNQEKYYIPELRNVIEEKKLLTSKYNDQIIEIDKKIKIIQDGNQKPLNLLLTTKGDELKDAVKIAFEYLGWNVIDVDKQGGDAKEKGEDLWLLKSSEYDLKKDEYIIVEVKGDIKRGANDEDCYTILKYLTRHLREYKNDLVKGLFVYNHAYGLSIDDRPVPFSSKQNEDAISNNYGLISTYTLFQYIKAEMEGLITKAQINENIKNALGEIVYKI